MSKTFLLNPSILPSTPEQIDELNRGKEAILFNKENQKNSSNKLFFEREETLQSIGSRTIVKVNIEEKNYWKFNSGLKIRYERNFNNFNRRQTQPINATVIASDYIPTGAEILIHHNSLHDTNKIFDYPDQLSTHENESDIRYFSIPQEECFAYRVDKEFIPTNGFDFGLRIFKPYSGLLQNIEPTLIKNVLFVTTGEFKNKAVHVLSNSDYQMVFQDTNGREGNIIRFRHYPNDFDPREEVLAVDFNLTESILKGELLIGLTKSNCYKFNQP